MTLIKMLQCEAPSCKCKRPQTDGYWLGHCPVPGHGKGLGDQAPSLLYRESRYHPGKLFVYCFANCPPAAIYAALGLPPDGRLPGGNGEPPEPSPAPGTPPAAPRPSAEAPAEVVATVRTPNQTASDAGAWLAAYCGVDPAFLAALERYGYLAFEEGRVCFRWPNVPGVQKVRRAGSKDFFWQGDPTPPLWPEPGNAEGGDGTLYLTEGESDAIVLLSLGLSAFAITKGASARPDQAVWSALKARGWRRVVLLFDADAPGRQGAERLAADIRAAGLEAIPVDLAGAGLVDPLRGQKDLRDAWRSGRFQDLDAFRGHILAAVTLPGTSREGACQVRLPLREADALDLGGDPVRLESLPLLSLPGYVIRGWGHILAGYPKAGKTDLLYACARDWVRAGWKVLWISEETEVVWKARLARHGAPPDRGLTIVFALGTDPAALLERAAESDADVIILDTARTLLRLEDESDNSAVALALSAWEAALQGKTRIYVHHVRKSGGEHGHAIAGASAFLATVDRAIELKFDSAKPQTRRILEVFSRIETPPPLMYELDGNQFRALGDPSSVERRDVEARILEALEAAPGAWHTTSEVLEALGDPKPSRRQVLQALQALHGAGRVERDPKETRPGATYRWRLPGPVPDPGAPPGDGSTLPGTPPLYRCEVRSRELSEVGPTPDPAPGGLDGPDGLDEDPDLADIPEAEPPPDGELEFLFDGASPEGPPWPLDTFEPALNAGPVPCTVCRHPIATGMAVRSRLDPEGRRYHVNCAPVQADPDPPGWLPRCRVCRGVMALTLTRRQAIMTCSSCQRRVRLPRGDPRIRAVLKRVTQDPDIATWVQTLGGEVVIVGPGGGS